jgi:uncharacterized protein
MRFSTLAGPAVFALFAEATLACSGSPGMRGVATVTPTSAPTLAPAQGAEVADSDAPDLRGAPRAPLVWAPFDATTFARAKSEHKLVVLDGAAEWCHWCHVMEATTYHDPSVRQILDAHFIAAKVDVDARPDIEERYGAYGWPATVLFSSDGAEIGKYRGYIAPEAFTAILRAVTEAPVPAADGRGGGAQPSSAEAASPKGPLSEDELGWIRRMTELELADYYDPASGGWGKWQKAAVAADNAWALRRARAGDVAAKEAVLFTLDKQRALIDPVWGGIYQYSAASDWAHPHFEKLMTFQAGALENYAEAYGLTRDPRWLVAARAMRGYIGEFLLGAEGGFYATQDADLNAHEPGKRFMTGHEYYALDDAHRRALGIPRVDRHEYGKENGLAIAAEVTFYEATGDTSALASAERAAGRILTTHAAARGGITHNAGEKPSAILHLADNAAFGFALARLYEASKEELYLLAAGKIADFLLRDLADDQGGFFASSADPDAVGVFAVRRKPFEDNVTALRLLARLARLAPAGSGDRARYARAIAGTLRAIATPDEIKARGRVLGDFLLALEETSGVR